MIKILVGDDDLEFARQSMPNIPNAEIEFVETADAAIRRAASDEFDIVITDLNYTPSGEEGFEVLKSLKGVMARRILWTGAGQDPAVRAKAAEFGAEVLAKNELGSLVGLAVSKKPLKNDGQVFVYVPQDGSIASSLKKVLHSFFKSKQVVVGSDLKTDDSIACGIRQILHSFVNPEQVVVGSDLKTELMTGRYGLVIDTSIVLSGQGSDQAVVHGDVAHDMMCLDLPAVPHVVCLRNITLIPGMRSAIDRFSSDPLKVPAAG